MEYTRHKFAPEHDKELMLWWSYAKRRKDWFMLIVLDDISGLIYPVYVPQFDDDRFFIARYHRQNDQRVVAVYETFGD